MMRMKGNIPYVVRGAWNNSWKTRPFTPLHDWWSGNDGFDGTGLAARPLCCGSHLKWWSTMHDWYSGYWLSICYQFHCADVQFGPISGVPTCEVGCVGTLLFFLQMPASNDDVCEMLAGLVTDKGGGNRVTIRELGQGCAGKPVLCWSTISCILGGKCRSNGTGRAASASDPNLHKWQRRKCAVFAEAPLQSTNDGSLSRLCLELPHLAPYPDKKEY